MAGFLRSKEEGRKVKSTGWAAFDRKMKGNDLTQNDHHKDPFPPVSDHHGNSTDTKHWIPPQSFSSVVRNYDDSVYHQHAINAEDNMNDVSIERLKSIHGWADESLIADILAGADNDEDKASALLDAMMPFDEKEIISTPSNAEMMDDDLYLTHRKDAIKMMRSAANSSRAATNAYQRGDHHTARSLSQKAHEERMIADELNKKAAQNILLVRNSNNGMWKLDFHGLHASEAVTILNDHLFRVEALLSSENSASLGSMFKGQRVLQVITGTGNHSRGPAALPAAVRGFLNEKGYRFEEERPGVITVWPKFRRKSSMQN